MPNELYKTWNDMKKQSIMSLEVKSIDTNQAKAELKKCPKIVQDYVRSLEGVYEMNRATLNKAIAKLKTELKWQNQFTNYAHIVVG